MKNSIKRTAALLTAALMLLPAAMSGCAQKKEPVLSKLTHVYDAQELPLPEEIEYPSYLTISGGQVYFSTQQWNEGSSTYTVYRMGLNGEDLNAVLELSGSDFGVNTMTPLSDGRIWLSMESYGSDPETGEWYNHCSLKQYSPEGEELININLNEAFPEEEYFYFNRICLDTQDNMYLLKENSIYQFSPDGSILSTCEIDTDYVNNFYMIDDVPYVLTYSENKGSNQLSILDFASGEMTPMENVEAVSNHMYNLFPAPQDSAYDFYYNNMTALCGFDLESGTSTELCNWINSDINGYNLGNLVVLDDSRLLCSSGEVNDEGDYVNKLYLMTRIPEEQIPEKYILTLAALDVPYEIREEVLKFNRASEEYRITLKNYGDYNTAEDYTVGLTRFNNDLISGIVPDIMILSDTMPIESYSAKGLFADLYTYIDADPEIKREDYLTNILDAFSTNGKLYQISPTFSVRTLAGKTALVGSGKTWTVTDMMNLARQYPDASLFRDMPREAFVGDLTTLLIGEFVNKDTGECSFDSENFIQYLNFLTTLSEKSAWDDYDWENDDGTFMENYESGFRKNLYLLNNAYLATFSGYWSMKAGMFGEDINLIGYPTAGSSGSAIVPSLRLAISGQSLLSDGAWQFVRTFLMDKYQNENGQWQFGIKLSALEAQAKEAMEVDTWTNEETGEVITYPGMYYLGSEEIEIGEIDQASVDEVMNFLKSLTLVSSRDTEMQDIILEEINAFLGGGKTAEQTAKLIQNRVQTYVSESR